MPPSSHKVIPNVIIRPFVQEFLSRNEMGLITQNSVDGLNKTQGRSYSGLDALAFLSGVSTRRIYDILNVDKNCLIDTADKIFCAMDKPYLWYVEAELRRYYYPERIAA
jgi:hypothetical protein